jgi:hypothetical protein
VGPSWSGERRRPTQQNYTLTERALRVRERTEASFHAPLVELAAHPLESGLGEVRQSRIAMVVAFQHPKSHQAKQHGTGHFILRA